MSVISPNMSLIISTINVDSGLAWEQNLNSSLTILDGHNHANGSGVQINPTGLDINADLPFGSNNATFVRSVRFTPQTSPLSLSTDIGCIYESGVDLYYNDGNGNKIQITASGGVAGANGSISGLTSPASASYNSGTGTFLWKAGSTTSANMDMAAITIRQFASGSPNGVTIQSPASLAANYTLTLPTAIASASNSFISSDTSGNLGYLNVDNSTLVVSTGQIQVPNGGITRPKLASVGQQVSSSSGTFVGSSTSFVAITNLTVTITTSGRPVMIWAQYDGLGTATDIAATSTTFLQLLRGSTVIGYYTLSGSGIEQMFPLQMDAVSAGTYTYSYQIRGTGGSYFAENIVMVAYEL